MLCNCGPKEPKPVQDEQMLIAESLRSSTEQLLLLSVQTRDISGPLTLVEAAIELSASIYSLSPPLFLPESVFVS